MQFSWAVAPEGSSQTRQPARKAFALKPIVLDPVWGEKCVGRIEQPCHVPEERLKDRTLYGGHITLKRGKSDLFDLCTGVQTVLLSEECPQPVDKPLETPFQAFNLAVCFFSLCPWQPVPEHKSVINTQLFNMMIFKGHWEMESEAGMGEGRRNAHPVIPWFARRQALYSSSARAQWALYRGANQPCQAIASLIKGQERGALSANDWGENKTYSVFD